MITRLILTLSLVPTLVAGTYDPRPDLEAGRYLRTLAAAEAMLQAEPGNALAWAAKAQALTALQRFGEGLQAAEKAMDLAPQLADAMLARGLARAGLAVQQRNPGSLRHAVGALKDLERATQADPRLGTAWLSLGLAYQQLPNIMGGSTPRALACAESLRLVAPARGQLLQGLVLAMGGHWAEAEPCFARALAEAPADPEIVYGYLDALGSGNTRRQLGEGEQKRRLAEEARRLLPFVKTRARAIEAIADALLDAGHPEEAWSITKGALGQADAPSLVRLQLGKIAARSNLHQEEGLACLEQALREPMEGGSAGHAGASWRKGQILKALGRIEEARAAAEGALKRDSKHRGARRLLLTL
jgi:tetratricopeptide (TPR) repeat protein